MRRRHRKPRPDTDQWWHQKQPHSVAIANKDPLGRPDQRETTGSQDRTERMARMERKAEMAKCSKARSPGSRASSARQDRQEPKGSPDRRDPEGQKDNPERLARTGTRALQGSRDRWDCRDLLARPGLKVHLVHRDA